MKSKILLTASTLLVSLMAFSQYEKPEKKESAKHATNIFKVNLTAIVLKNYSFQYERVLSR
ncbi:MAG: hypothetical protein RIR31_768, partial [Bacteroidota bacterium]